MFDFKHFLDFGMTNNFGLGSWYKYMLNINARSVQDYVSGTQTWADTLSDWDSYFVLSSHNPQPLTTSSHVDFTDLRHWLPVSLERCSVVWTKPYSFHNHQYHHMWLKLLTKLVNLWSEVLQRGLHCALE